MMISHDLNRFGRDVRNIANNRYELRSWDVEEHFITGANDTEFIKNINSAQEALAGPCDVFDI